MTIHADRDERRPAKIREGLRHLGVAVEGVLDATFVQRVAGDHPRSILYTELIT